MFLAVPAVGGAVASSDVQRRLAAVLSADVVGYSRLMGDDEEATVATLGAYRKVLTSKIKKHRAAWWTPRAAHIEIKNHQGQKSPVTEVLAPNNNIDLARLFLSPNRSRKPLSAKQTKPVLGEAIFVIGKHYYVGTPRKKVRSTLRKSKSGQAT